MNKQQRNYLNAKAALETAKMEKEKIVSDYIKENNIVNSDGEIPLYDWHIESDEVFDAMYKEIGDKIDALQISSLTAQLEDAEDELIEFGLSIMPVFMEKQKDILRRASLRRLNDKIFKFSSRDKVINATARLDVKSIRMA